MIATTEQIIDILDTQTPIPHKIWGQQLREPFDANIKAVTNSGFCHEIITKFITAGGLAKNIGCDILIEKYISKVFFLHAEREIETFQDGYWLCIGELTTKQGIMFFAYETSCCGTGFGFCEKTEIHIARTLSALVTFGLTNQNRSLILDNSI